VADWQRRGRCPKWCVAGRLADNLGLNRPTARCSRARGRCRSGGASSLAKAGSSARPRGQRRCRRTSTTRQRDRRAAERRAVRSRSLPEDESRGPPARRGSAHSPSTTPSKTRSSTSTTTASTGACRIWVALPRSTGEVQTIVRLAQRRVYRSSRVVRHRISGARAELRWAHRGHVAHDSRAGDRSRQTLRGGRAGRGSISSLSK